MVLVWYDVTETLFLLIGLAVVALAVAYGAVPLVLLLLLMTALLGHRVDRWWLVPLWPFAAVLRLAASACGRLFRLFPHGRRGELPDDLRRLIAGATAVEVHSAALTLPGNDPGCDWRSLGAVRVESPWGRRRVIREVLRANRECLVSFPCLDAEYGVRLATERGTVDLMICFRCGQARVSVAGAYLGWFDMGRRLQPLLDWLLRAKGVAPSPGSLAVREVSHARSST